MRIRKLLVTAAATAAIAVPVLAATAAPAFANTGNNWCIGTTSECLNAWNGGPWVKLYTNGTTTNGDFLWDHGLALPAQYLIFGNTASNWFGNCIGDAFNNANDARASLDPCPGQNGGSGSGDGWGTHILRDTTVCGSGWVAFKDLHWNAWIGPESETQGAQIYLNKPNPYCYQAYPTS